MNNPDALDTAKHRLRIPELWRLLGLAGAPAKSCRVPWRDDQNPSGSVYDEGRRFHDHATGEDFDAPDFLARARSLSLRDAISEFKRLAGVDKEQPGAPPVHSNLAQSPRPDFDWPRCVAAFTPDHQARLAAERRYSVEFVSWLAARQLIGLFGDGHPAFPVHDPAGRVLGCHFRLEDGSWRYHPAGTRAAPLIIGDLGTSLTAFAFESQWDAAALLDALHWHIEPVAGTTVVVTRGAANAKLLAGLLSPDATLHAFAQNDPAGQKWLADLAAGCGCKCVHVVTPAPHKDLNDWTRSGATAEDIRRAIADAQPYTPPPDLHAAPPRRVSRRVVALPPDDESDAAADTPAPFPLGCLPPAMALMAAGAARTARVPDRLTGACVLGIASAAIGAGLEVQADAPPAKPLRPNLFLLVSAETGCGKSRTFDLIAAPLLDYQERLQELWRKESAPRLQSQIKAAEAKIKRLEKDIAKENDAEECERLRAQLEFKLAERDELARQNAQPVLLAQDATTERLTAMVEEQGEVLFSASSDCRKVVSNVLGRYTKDSSSSGGKETDETFYLAGYSGDHVRVDRGSRPPVNLRRPCLGLLWFGQPDLVNTMLAKDSLSASGFLPRLLICHSHAAPQRIEGEAEVISERVLGDWSKLVTDLLTAYRQPGVHHVLQPTPEARQKFVDYHNAIVERRKTELRDVTGFAARWCENSWRLAVVLHAGLHGANAQNHPLESETTENAIRLSAWFANEQLDILAKGRRTAAEKVETEVLDLLQTRQERQRLDYLTARDVLRARIVVPADAAHALLDRMERAGLLVGEDIAPPHGGTTKRIYRANPVPG